MLRTFTVVLVAVTACGLVGCTGGAPGPTSGMTRLMGNVAYADAFTTAETVLGRTFEIASSDSGSGEIRSQPRYVNAAGERVLGNSPARQLATMHLKRVKGQVYATLTIVQQRQGAEIRKVMAPPGDPYSTVPDETPAQDTAATTDEQNSAWGNERRMNGLEARILEELYDALHRQAASAPATTRSSS